MSIEFVLHRTTFFGSTFDQLALSFRVQMCCTRDVSVGDTPDSIQVIGVDMLVMVANETATCLP